MVNRRVFIVVDIQGSIQLMAEMKTGTASLVLDALNLTTGQYFLLARDTGRYLISSSRFRKR